MKVVIRSNVPVASLKFNYKCKSGTIDDSNKCDTELSDEDYKKDRIDKMVKEIEVLEKAKSEGKESIKVGRNTIYVESYLKMVKEDFEKLTGKSVPEQPPESRKDVPKIDEQSKVSDKSSLVSLGKFTKYELDDNRVGFKYESGHYITVPKEFEKMVPDVANVLEKMPEKLASKINTIRIQKEVEPAEWLNSKAKLYSEGKTIVICGDGKKPYNVTVKDMAHELAHSVDGSNYSYSYDKRYISAVESDGSKRTPSEYARWGSRNYDTSRRKYSEDLAVSMELYVASPDRLEKRMPARYNYIKNIMKV
jgi:hypothetical protein